MVVTAWIIGIVIFLFTLFSVWGMFFLLFLFFVGLLVLSNYTGFDPLIYLGEDNINMVGTALFGSWALAAFLSLLGRIFGFVDDVGKAAKNLADDDRRRY